MVLSARFKSKYRSVQPGGLVASHSLVLMTGMLPVDPLTYHIQFPIQHPGIYSTTNTGEGPSIFGQSCPS